MSTSATRATAALLCAVAFGALVLAFVGLPTSKAVAEPVNLDLSFSPFAPGVTQTRRSVLDVPVASTVRKAEAGATTGPGTIDVTFELCRLDACRPLAAGDRIEPGVYSIAVSATMSPELEPGTDATLVGQLQLAETDTDDAVRPTLILVLAGIAAGGILVIVLTGRARTARASRRAGAVP